MALPMDEQRILAEIESRLAADDPSLACSLSGFTPPRLTARLVASRARLLAGLIAVAAISLASLMVYSFVPIRVIAHQSPGPQQSTQRQAASPRRIAQARPATLASGDPSPALPPAAVIRAHAAGR
jgi:Protein of unknown function (DUF3040)